MLGPIELHSRIGAGRHSDNVASTQLGQDRCCGDVNSQGGQECSPYNPHLHTVGNSCSGDRLSIPFPGVLDKVISRDGVVLRLDWSITCRPSLMGLNYVSD